MKREGLLEAIQKTYESESFSAKLVITTGLITGVFSLGALTFSMKNYLNCRTDYEEIVSSKYKIDRTSEAQVKGFNEGVKRATDKANYWVYTGLGSCLAGALSMVTIRQGNELRRRKQIGKLANQRIYQRR